MITKNQKSLVLISQFFIFFTSFFFFLSFFFYFSLCRRVAVESTDSEELVLSTSDQPGVRTMSSSHDSHQFAKGSLSGWRGWKTKANDGNQWQKLDLARVETVYGVVTSNTQWHWNRYVRSFTVQTSLNNNNDWVPVLNGKIFKGNRQDNYNQKFIRWNEGINARFVKILPVSWNYDIAMRWDVIVSPGKVKGRYVTLFAQTQLSVCEIRVYPEQTPSSRSALCSPQEMQPLCRAPQLETITTESTNSNLNYVKQVPWSESVSFLTSAVSVVSTELVATKLASVCGMPRLQVKVDDGLWKTVKTIASVQAEQNGFPSTEGKIKREAPLLVIDQSRTLHIGQLRHVACSSSPTNAQSPASRVQRFEWTQTIDR